MRLIQYFSDGQLSFNWDQLPEHIREKTELRDNIFKELQERMKVNEFMTTRALYDLNKYAIDRIRSEIKTQWVRPKN
jgi:hypothetical protein